MEKSWVHNKNCIKEKKNNKNGKKIKKVNKSNNNYLEISIELGNEKYNHSSGNVLLFFLRTLSVASSKINSLLNFIPFFKSYFWLTCFYYFITF